MSWLNEPHSLRFKRARSLFVREWDEASELVGLVKVIGLNAARWIFAWRKPEIAKYQRLEAEVGGDYPDLRGHVDGLEVLTSMQRGGWQRGPLPKVVRDVLREMHHSGMTYGQIGAVVGMTEYAVQWACRKPWVKPTQDADAFAALAL